MADILPATRVSDGTVGTCNLGLECCPHSRAGTNSTGSENVFINGLAAHRLTDSGSCNCPHGGVFQSTSGSSTVFINDLAATRINDATTCQVCGQGGNHAGGSENVFIG